MLIFDSGLLGPTANDVLRIAILVVGLVNVSVLFVVVRTLRHNARLLLDMEQFAREVRNWARYAGPSERGAD